MDAEALMDTVIGTRAGELASWVVSRTWDDLSPTVRERLRMSVLDAIGCAIGGLQGPPVRAVRSYLDEVGGAPNATLIGGGKTSADRAALFNGAAIRYLDFNDTFAAKGESCHPSDNVAPILAAAEQSGASGRDFLVALAVAYQVQCHLSEVAPVRARGFDHTVLGMLGMACGAARARGLGVVPTSNAIAITGTAFNALRVTRTGRLSNWKGLAAPNAAFAAVHAVSLAAHGVTGPDQMFEGNKGLIETITGPFELDWSTEPLDRLLRCNIKKYNAEFHSQSAVEAALAIRQQPGFDPTSIERISVETFATGFHIIGGGEEGDKKAVRTKEDADHSLPYIIAIALLDGEVAPAQYAPERIASADVQALLERVDVFLDDSFSERFPEEMPARVEVHLKDGTVLVATESGYPGFYTRPFDWDAAV
ncbi:MAG TPA: MmgE/PrpD family protein, partial [Kofleriaceae bacterium]